jgi:pimeloyl-ACP methyl ester carboxylesterase
MTRPWRRAFVLALALCTLMTTAPSTLAQTGRSTAAPADSDFTGLVDVGGRGLFLECKGTGDPTVLLEAGYRSPATVWTDDLVQPEAPRTMVLPGVAAFTHVCTYERPGTDSFDNGAIQRSRSDVVPMPRTAGQLVDELHTLLHVAGVPGPYVLVGHSLGGLLVQLYASTYPDDIVGLVLVDALPDQLRELLTPAQWQFFVSINSAVPPALADDGGYETVDFDAATTSMQRARAAEPLRPMPLYVLSHGQPWGPDVPTDVASGFDPAVYEQVWQAGQDDLARLVPDARHSVATDSGHYIQLQQPQLVIDAIDQVVEAVRDPDTWSAPPVQLPAHAAT